MRETPQRNIGRRSRETFRAREFNRRHSQALDVTRVADRAHRDPIVNLENLLPCAAERDEDNPVTIPDGRNRTALRELGLDVLAPVRNRFHPTIRFFDHATLCLKIPAIFSSGRVLIPSPETILISGKILPPRSTPPVDVSASAAVSSARNAIATASSSLNSRSFFAPQLFS